jgi:hypothetical protein
MRRTWLSLAVVALLAAGAPAANAAVPVPQGSVTVIQNVAPKGQIPEQDPLSPTLFLPYSPTDRPRGFGLNALQAERAADAAPQARAVRARHPKMKPTAYLSPLQLRQGAFWHWDVIYTDGDNEVVEVEVDAVTGKVLQVTTPPDIGWPLLLGFKGVLGGKLNAPYIWLPLCLLFLLPFIDPRRPFRLLHLDLLVLLAFGISQIFFTAGKPGTSVPLVYPFLLYAAVRAAWAGFRPARRDGPLMPFVSTRFLIAGVLSLLALRVAFSVTSSGTFDISTAGVIGANRIEHGLQLYTDNSAHGDTYGPLNYLLYIPWEMLFPFKAPFADAARGATLMFDTLTVLGLFLLGRSLRRGPAGIRLGAGLAWAWAAFPYTALVLASNTNDALVPLFLVYALLFLRSPPARGVLAGLASMGKFAPAIVAPIIIVGRGPFRWRPVLIAATGYAIVCVGLVVAFLPPGGLREFWNTTLGFQLSRSSPLSIWVRQPSLDWLRPLASVSVVGLAAVATFFPRRRSVGQVAALCGAVLAAAQVPGNYWLYFYVVWFAPFLFIGLFEEYRDLGPIAASASGEGDQRLREPGEDLAAGISHDDQVLDPHAQHAG